LLESPARQTIPSCSQANTYRSGSRSSNVSAAAMIRNSQDCATWAHALCAGYFCGETRISRPNASTTPPRDRFLLRSRPRDQDLLDEGLSGVKVQGEAARAGDGERPQFGREQVQTLAASVQPGGVDSGAWMVTIRSERADSVRHTLSRRPPGGSVWAASQSAGQFARTTRRSGVGD
jgi:hypothetical protein